VAVPVAVAVAVAVAMPEPVAVPVAVAAAATVAVEVLAAGLWAGLGARAEQVGVPAAELALRAAPRLLALAQP
jgi:putative ubiquitin-RnfH superfamily antitoxin RatB of RatAB toxin-antitoxin module